MHDRQHTLNIRLKDSASLENFVAGDNPELLAALHVLAGSEPVSAPAGEHTRFVYVWGASGAGKSHLLQGVCHLAAQHRLSLAYIPLSLPEMELAYLQALDDVALICIDDVHLIAGKPDWEQACFHLYNRVRERGHRLLMSANAPPAGLQVQLADLRSRLAWGLVYQVQALDDAGKLTALQRQAQRRGFELPDNVARYVLSRCPRDSHSLFAVLDKLDQASLAAQRKLTIPFVRELL